MKLLTATLLAAAALTASSVTADAATLAGRQRNQVNRTCAGITSGQINRDEARSLANGQRNIHKRIVRDRIDGRGFTARERAHAGRALDRQSRRIAAARHNGR
ncbi:MAG: hypothetical protein IH602_00005 [Bryobacteraceae bacterium]|nr:hypothetical protein [Bryobacteraceae bacterium]